MTVSRPLPRALRSEAEDAFGASFAGVRVHESALAGAPACARGEDVYFAPDAYDPSTPAGRAVLGHELAHVLQQRFGRVRRGAGRALEAEADAAGRGFAAGGPVRIPGRPAGRPTLATQCYQVIAPGNRGLHGLAVVNAAVTVPTNPQDSFIVQRKGGAAAMNPRSFRLAGGAVNLVSSNQAGVTLRLSANGNMAIEDADLSQRQPKVFYATAAVVNESNDRLTLLGSDYRLDTDPAGANQRRITVAGQVLLRVMPRNVNVVSAGLTMLCPEHCNSMFDGVAGPTAPQGPQPAFANALNPVPHATLLEYHVARELIAPVPAVLNNATPVNLGNTMRAIAVPYAAAMRGAAAGFVADLQQYGLNEYAAPYVGEGFVTCSLLAVAPGAGVSPAAMPATYEDHYQLAAGGGQQVVQHARSWTSHYGGVVAKDGADVVTLENYARNVEDGGMVGECRYYFQMYDTNPPLGGARSWHHAWVNTPMQPIPGGGAAPATHEPVSPGARGFTNPLTMRVSVPDARYNAVAAAAHGAAAFNTIKDHHNLIAGAPDAHQELLHVLKGLYYANTRLAMNKAGRASRVQAWRAATHAAYGANRFPANRQAIGHTYGRLVMMATS